ncbi:MAG: hypothetical protein GX349_05810 [Firmicutes bacterium]|nr:hypothetical protein [Bacillota bacterium]
MMTDLLKWKWRLLWRSTGETESKKVGTIILSLLAFVWFLVAFLGSRFFFLILAELAGEMGQDFGPPLLGDALSGLYLLGLVVSLFTACGSAFSVMYSSSDLPLLFAAPLRIKQVFLIKFLEILASVFIALVLLTLPVMLGFGASIGVRWSYYPAMLLLTLFILLWPTALGAVLNLFVMRIIPPYRVREVGVALGSLLGGLAYAAIQLGTRSITSLDAGQVARITGSLSFARIGFSPASWLAQATLAASQARWSGFFLWAGLVAISGLIFFSLCLFLVQEAFYGGWAGSAEVGRCKKEGPKGWALGRWLAGFLPRGIIMALAGKEIKMISRDLREWSQAIYMLVVLSVGIIVPFMGRANPFSPQDISDLPLGIYFFFIFFTSSMLSSSLALGSLAREGKSWPLLRTSPTTNKEILYGKLVGLTPLIFFFIVILTFILTLLLGDRRFFLMAGFTLLTSPGLVAINIAAGTISPKFDAPDPRQRVSIPAVHLSMLAEVGYGVVVALTMTMGGANIWMGKVSISGLLGFLLFLGAAITSVLLPIALGAENMDAAGFAGNSGG